MHHVAAVSVSLRIAARINVRTVGHHSCTRHFVQVSVTPNEVACKRTGKNGQSNDTSGISNRQLRQVAAHVALMAMTAMSTWRDMD